MSIAVAGGTGGLGHALIEAIQARGVYRVLVLTRKVSGTPAGPAGVQFLAVDYTNIDTLADILQENNVDTVISVANKVTHENEKELNLIRAAEKSTITTRFILSYLGVPCPPGKHGEFKPSMAKRTALSALKSTSLMWTTVCDNHLFNYFGTPKFKGNMDDFALLVEVGNNATAIPSSGNVPVVSTHAIGVASFIAALLERPNWPQETFVVGDKLIFHKLDGMVKGDPRLTSPASTISSLLSAG